MQNELINLYLVRTTGMLGDSIVEFRASEKSFEELTEDDDYNTYLGILDEEDATDMENLGIDCGDDDQLIKYAIEVKNFAIPDIYRLECREINVGGRMHLITKVVHPAIKWWSDTLSSNEQKAYAKKYFGVCWQYVWGKDKDIIEIWEKENRP